MQPAAVAFVTSTCEHGHVHCRACVLGKTGMAEARGMSPERATRDAAIAFAGESAKEQLPAADVERAVAELTAYFTARLTN